MPYSLVIKKRLILNIAFNAILIIIASKSIAQETIPASVNISESQGESLPNKPSPKNRTASPILKTTNKNSSKSINTSITSPTNSAPIKTNSNSTATNSGNPQLSAPSPIKENTNSSPVIASLPSPVINSAINKNNSSPPAQLPATTPKEQVPSPSTENKNTTDKNIATDTPTPLQDNKNLNQPQDPVKNNAPINAPVSSTINDVIPKKPIKKTRIAKKIKKLKLAPISKIKTPQTENKKFINENGRKINSDYFLQIIPKKSCDNLTNTECFRRDLKNEEPYFHRTIVSIFNGRIVAEQYFATTNVTKKIFLKVSNGNYQLTTTNDNLITFSVEDGNVKDLNLFSGNISRETFTPTKCAIAEKNYGFSLAHNQKPKISETNYFANKNNFEGVRNLVIFSNIENIENLTLQDLMAVEVRAYNYIAPIENLNICKRAKSDILEVREISKAECRKRQECLILLNSNPDFQNKIIDESCLGYFDSKRGDYVSCSQQDDCEDFAIIKDCEVKFMAGK